MSKLGNKFNSLHSKIKCLNLIQIILILLESIKIFSKFNKKKMKKKIIMAFKGKNLVQIQILKKLYQKKNRPKKL